MSHVCSFFFQFGCYRYFCLPLSSLCLFVSFPSSSCYPFQPVSSHRSDLTETTVWRRTSFRPVAVLSSLFPQLHVLPGEKHSWKAPMQRPGGCSGHRSPHPWGHTGRSLDAASKRCVYSGDFRSPGRPGPEPPGPLQLPQGAHFPRAGQEQRLARPRRPKPSGFAMWHCAQS